MASTIIPISPINFNIEELSSNDQSILTSNFTDGKVTYGRSKIEFHIYDLNNNLISSNENISEWNVSTDLSVSKNTNPVSVYETQTPNTNENTSVTLDPESNLINSGYAYGIYNVLYNFTEYQFGSSPVNQFYISEISSDRTEIKITNNFIPSGSLQIAYEDFKLKYSTDTFFDEFYINFGDNNLYLGINVLLDVANASTSGLFIKLYEPLPLDFDIKSQLWVVTKTADSVAYKIEVETPSFNIDTILTLGGPNTNIQTPNQLSNPSTLFSYNTLVSSSISSSKDQLKSYLYDNSVDINIDYNYYSNFVFYSSATNRLNNFYLKAQEIENYNNDITSYDALTATPQVSNSIVLLESKISNIIEKFDGYEYFLYFTSGSYAWPKTNSTPPYTLASTGSLAVLNWYGSDTYGSTYYGGQYLSASTYDTDNLDILTNLVPNYLKEGTYDSQNYLTFTNMIGQSFDNVWVYTNNITSKFNADNRLDYGASPELVADILRSFGLPIYTNNFSTNDSYLNLLGYGSDGQLYPTGSEKIDLIITSSADPLSQNELNLQTYKRLLHNLPYLYSKKGSIEAIRILATIFGIPDTILQISEFGGQDEINFNDYDYWYNQYNYAYYTSGSNYISSSFVLNSAWNSPDNVPQSVEFRFKTDGLPYNTASIASQSLWSTDENIKLILRYTGSGYTSGSYSGSIPNPYNKYALLDFIPDPTSPQTSASIYLPFYNGGWWSVLINKTGSNYTLYAQNNIYSGSDGNFVAFTGSSSVNPFTEDPWNNSVKSYFGISSSLSGKKFTGSFQEIRYYTINPSQNDFNDYTMNPYSIEGDGTTTAPETLAFRASLGGELYSGSTSIHPKVSGSWVYTSSFASNSNFYTGSGVFVNNYDYFFLNQFPSGIRNRVSNKVRQENNVLPYSASTDPYLNNNTPNNNVLSAFRSIQQNVPQSGSYTPDINYVEVGFSPQNVINNDIASQLGYFNLGELIGDPRQVSESRVTYQDLDVLRNYYFEKYYKNYSWNDFTRLIQFYDNSLFKLVKDFTPSRSGLASGIIIKQSVLERNKYPVPQVDTYTTTSYYGTGSSSNPSWDTPNVFQNLQFTGSVKSIPVWDTASQTPVLLPSLIEHISGSDGGSLPNTWLPSSSLIYSNPSELFFSSNLSIVLTASSGNYLLTMDVISNATNVSNNDKFYAYDSNIPVFGDDPLYNKILSIPFTSSTTSSISASFSTEYGTVLTFDFGGGADFLYVDNIVLTSYPYAYNFNNITIPTPLGPTTGSLTNEGYFNGVLSGSEIIVDNNGNLLPNPLLTQEYVASIPSLQSLSVITKKSSSATLPNTSYDINPDGFASRIFTSSGFISYSVVNNAELYPSYNTSSFIFTPEFNCIANVSFYVSGSLYGSGLNNASAPTASISCSFIEETNGIKSEFAVLGPFTNFGLSPTTTYPFSQSLTFPNITLKGGYTYSINYNIVSQDVIPSAGGAENVTGSINTSSFWNIDIVNPNAIGFPADPSIQVQQLFPGNLEIYGDYNAIYNNVYSNRLSRKYFDVDYAALGDTLPVNQSLLLSSSATFAQIQDSNYSLARSIYPRYVGSKNTSAKYNFYTPSGSGVPTVLGTASFWPGDQSYGKTAAIEKYTKYFAVFDWISSSAPEYPGGGNIHIINLIDIEGKITTLTDNNYNLFNVSQTFKKGDPVTAYQISGSQYTTFPKITIVEGGAFFDTVATRSGSGDFSISATFESGSTIIYSTSSFAISQSVFLKDSQSVGWLFPFITGSSPNSGALDPNYGIQVSTVGAIGGTSIFIKNKQSSAYFTGSGIANIVLADSYLPLKYGDYIRFGTTATSSMDSNFYGTGSYQLISAQTGSDFSFSSSLYMNYITGSVPVNPITQNWRIVRRVPNETFVLISNLPTFTGKGLLVPYNFDPKYDPIEVAKKAGLL